jgi:hypothetical protein
MEVVRSFETCLDPQLTTPRNFPQDLQIQQKYFSGSLKKECDV